MPRAYWVVLLGFALSMSTAAGFTAILQEDITEDTVWDISGSPYVVYGNLYVTASRTESPCASIR
jgi:hypothetical protein